MPQGTTPGLAGGLAGFLPFIFIILIFYFILIRPQIKKEKDMANMRANLKRGDNVITAGGVCGTVSDFKGDAVVLKVDDRTNLTVLRSAITGLQAPAEAAPAKTE